MGVGGGALSHRGDAQPVSRHATSGRCDAGARRGEEAAFWQQVRDTCAVIMGKPQKKYSAEALTRWYNGLCTDSAEYKMWGNGMALPCVMYVMQNLTAEYRKNLLRR